MTANHIKNEMSTPINPHSLSHLTHPKYRADIDGLRAIAILSVVGFHFFPELVKGGFIGVDIFFVISGYLISTIIVGSLERNSFSFVEFYTRRINRIFPALLLVLITCFSFGWYALLTDEYKQLGKHIAGGAGFISNFLFLHESGYFDNAAETKPLLHLWSLGIEEQFYIAWPLMLWLAWKQRLNLLTITVVTVLISFVLNVSKVNSDAVAMFYSPLTRFWELLAGAFLAQRTLHKHKYLPTQEPSTWFGRWQVFFVHALTLEANGNKFRNAQSFLGATLVLAGILMTNAKAFPGWWALLPTSGTLLIISAGKQAWLNRIVLSSRLLVWFGLISFPLYLWHWPLLSFAHIVKGATPELSLRVAIVAISIALAWLTYKLIENPLRFGNHSKIKTLILFFAMIVIGYVGYFDFKRDGLPFRAVIPLAINDGDIGHEIFHEYSYQKYFLCTPSNILKEADSWGIYIRCLQSKKDEPIKIALIGDSHAEHLFIGLAEALPNTNIVFYMKAGLPYIGDKNYENIFNYVIKDKNITTVVLTAAWARKGVPEKKIELSKTVGKLNAAGKTVYITDDVPRFSFDPAACKYLRRFNTENICKEDSENFHSDYLDYYPTLKLIEKENSNVRVLNTAKYFCGEGFCNMAKNGVLFYRDRNHLNINGSKFVGKRIVEEYSKIGK
jgi:peptidoglycan/LPS O-acetylase OafA/YrhL